MDGLSPGTRYEVQAALDSGFPAYDAQSTAFITAASGVIFHSFQVREASELPGDIWSDGATMWVVGAGFTGAFPALELVTDELFAYNLSTGARLPDQDIGLHSENSQATGIWSDGITMWVVDNGGGKLYAYDLATNAHVPARDIDLHASNNLAFGLTSDGSTMWVGQGFSRRLYAYDLATKARVPTKELDLSVQTIDNTFWTDGSTLWVTQRQSNKMVAYDLASKARVTARDITLHEDNGSPSGAWSNGVTMWVADLSDRVVYAYADAHLDGITADPLSAYQAKVTATVGYRFRTGPTDSLRAHLRYRTAAVDGGSPGPWVKAPPEAPTSDGRAEIMLTGLSPTTRYEVEMSLDGKFPAYRTLYIHFTTYAHAVSGILLADVNAHRAVGTVVINASGSGQAEQVHLRHRIEVAGGGSLGPWVASTTATTGADRALLDLTGLSPGTSYRVEASLDSDFPADATRFAVFDTDGIVSGISVASIAPHRAPTTVSVRRGPNQPVAGVYLRYRPHGGRGGWTVGGPVETVADQVEVTLPGLSAATSYEVQASLDAAFPADETQSASFTTADGVSSIALADITPYRASATARSAVSGRVGNEEIYLRYRTVAADDNVPGDWFTVAAERPAAVSRFNLTGLSPSTLYEVEAALSRAFPPPARFHPVGGVHHRCRRAGRRAHRKRRGRD